MNNNVCTFALLIFCILSLWYFDLLYMPLWIKLSHPISWEACNIDHVAIHCYIVQSFVQCPGLEVQIQWLKCRYCHWHWCHQVHDLFNEHFKTGTNEQKVLLVFSFSVNVQFDLFVIWCMWLEMQWIKILYISSFENVQYFFILCM